MFPITVGGSGAAGVGGTQLVQAVGLQRAVGVVRAVDTGEGLATCSAMNRAVRLKSAGDFWASTCVLDAFERLGALAVLLAFHARPGRTDHAVWAVFLKKAASPGLTLPVPTGVSGEAVLRCEALGTCTGAGVALQSLETFIVAPALPVVDESWTEVLRRVHVVGDVGGRRGVWIRLPAPH